MAQQEYPAAGTKSYPLAEGLLLKGVEACGFNCDLGKKGFLEQGFGQGAATVVSLARDEG